MALIAIDTDASMDGHGAMYVVSYGPFTAGEELLAASPCRLATDGKVYMADSDVCTISGVSDYLAFAPKAVPSGAVVSLYGKGARFSYSNEMTPNTNLFISSTAGRLDVSKVAANDSPVALAISASDIVVLR